jgi:hypothetical protein
MLVGPIVRRWVRRQPGRDDRMPGLWLSRPSRRSGRLACLRPGSRCFAARLPRSTGSRRANSSGAGSVKASWRWIVQGLRDGGRCDAVKTMALRRPDTCIACGAALPAGVRAVWDAQSRTVHCVGCSGEPRPWNPLDADVASKQSTAVQSAPSAGLSRARTPTVAPDAASYESAFLGAPGGSAQREYERRLQRREHRVRARHPRLGGLILALSDAPASTRVWAQGAAGERAVAA